MARPAASRAAREGQSTPKTARTRSRVSTASGGPSAATRPPSSTTRRGKKWRGQRQVVEDRQDRRPVARVEIGQELHDRHLVAQVEVDGRLVEDEERRRLGDRERDEHQLALAEGELTGVAAAQAVDPDPR